MTLKFTDDMGNQITCKGNTLSEVVMTACEHFWMKSKVAYVRVDLDLYRIDVLNIDGTKSFHGFTKDIK